MNIVFLGNHEVGIRALEAIRPLANITLVVAHPPDPEDGVRYPSLFEHARNHGLHAIRRAGKAQDLESCIREARPDLIWITDYRYLLSKGVIDLPRLGAVNLHPSLLPKYRGRAPINWAILNGEKFLGLTAHFLDEGLDLGDIILQERFQLHEDQDVGDALKILYPIYTRVCTGVMEYFLMGNVPRLPQDHTRATVFPRRTPEDGRIHWDEPAKRVLNLIRAVARPYPGAFTFHREKKMVIHAASLYPEGVKRGPLGEVLRVGEDGFLIRASQGALLVHEVEMEGLASAYGWKKVTCWKTDNMSHSHKETERIIRFYSTLLKKHGQDSRALDWGSRFTQALRFSVLSQIGCLEKCSILDVGRGLGDLLGYLGDLGIKVRYTGYDFTPAMIRKARRRFPGVQFEVGDLMAVRESGESFDYVLASGIFYLRQEDPLAYLERMVKRMFAFCIRGVAFNTLSDRAAEKNGGEFYADPCKVLDICTKITPWVVLRHDYLPNDFTVYLYKDANDRQHQST